MADPLSIAAAAVGFASLAGQLADGVLKLRDMHATMKNAPRDLSRLCSSMDILRTLLEEAGGQIQLLSSDDVDNAIVKAVFAQCEEARYRIAARVVNLSLKVQRNKAASLQFLSTKKEISEMLSDVERCKTDLIITRQGIEMAISSHRYETIIEGHAQISQTQSQLLDQAARVSQQIADATLRSTDEFQSIREAHQASRAKICESIRSLKDYIGSQPQSNSAASMVANVADTQRDILASHSQLEAPMIHRLDLIDQRSTQKINRKSTKMAVAFQSVLFSFSVEFSSEREDPIEEKASTGNATMRSICNIRLPRCFVQDQYNLMVKRAKNGWLFCPTVYRTVDEDCAFFQACGQGDLDTIKRFLSTKQAFLSDRSFSFRGASPVSALTKAIENQQLEVCELLVDAGILSQFEQEDYFRTIVAATIYWSSDGTGFRKVLRLIEPRDESGIEWVADLPLSLPINRVVRDLSHSVNDSGGSHLARFESSLFLSILVMSYGEALSTINTFCNDVKCVDEIRSASSSCSWLIFALAEALSKQRTWSRPWSDGPCRHTCFTLLIQLHGLGIDIHPRLGDISKEWQSLLITHSWRLPKFWSDNENCTPFLLMISAFLDPGATSKMMRFWVRALHVAGVDLEHYAEDEVWRVERLLRKSIQMGTCVYGVSHGPDPRDWGLLTSPPGKPDLACFWRNVEATSIVQDLAMRVFAVWQHMQPEQTTTIQVPGHWQEDDDKSEPLEQTFARWLTCMEDAELRELETELEEKSAKEFYETWDLEAVVEEWSAAPYRGACW